MKRIRVWDRNKKKMLYEGFVIKDNKIYYLERFNQGDYRIGGKINGKMLISTQTKDINGKEIYEGDIIEYTVHYDDWQLEKQRDVVKFKEIKGDSCGDPFVLVYMFKRHNCKVLGNIYENPELLKEGKNEESETHNNQKL